MTTNNLRKWLQLFGGEGGAGGTGASAGATAGAAEGTPASGEMADAAGQRLRELGVPEDKIRRNRASKSAGKLDRAVATAQKAQAPQQAAAAPATEEAQQEEEAPAKASWEDILKDPDYNRAMQDTVQKAKGKAKAAEAAMQALMPFLSGKAQEIGMTPDNMDYEVLARHLAGDYEQKAAELGVSTDIAMRLDQQDRALQQQQFDTHMRGLEQQANQLKAVYPSFDLRAEMEDPRFRRMTGPGIGMSVEDAYYAIHRAEIQAARDKAIQETTRQQMANAISAGQRRPAESGTVAQAPSSLSFDYRKATKQQRASIKDQIRAASARGEKLYPGEVKF